MGPIRRTVGRVSLLLAASALLAPAGTGAAAPPDTIRTSASVYANLGFSVLGADSSVASVLSPLGAPDPLAWRLFSWNPTNGVYDEGPRAFGSIRRGRGYWLITRDARALVVHGDTLAADSLDVPLSGGPGVLPGWNQLANPYPYAIGTGDWRLLKADSLVKLDSTANIFTDRAAGIRAALPPYAAVNAVARDGAFWMRVVDPDTAARWVRWGVPLGGTPTSGRVLVDAKGDLHVVYATSVNGPLYYVRRHGLTCGAPEPVGLSGSIGDIVLDRSLQPVVVAYSGGAPSYATRTPTGWSHVDLYFNGFTGTVAATRVAFDHANAPHFAIWDQSGMRVLHATRLFGEASWRLETAFTVLGTDYIKDVCIQMDSGDAPHILFVSGNDGTGTYPIYATRDASGNWTSETIPISDRVSWIPWLRIDSQDRPHVMFMETSPSIGTITYGTRSGTIWNYGTLPATAPTGASYRVFGFELTAQDRAVAAVSSNGGGAVMLLREGELGWSADTISVGSAAGRVSGLTLALRPDGDALVGMTSLSSPSALLYERSDSVVRLRLAPTRAGATTVPPDAFANVAAWGLTLTAQQDGRANAPLELGAMAPGRGDAAAFRVPRLPPVPDGRTPELWVTRRNISGADGDYMRDVRPDASEVAWSVTLAGGDAPGEITLALDRSRLPADAHVRLSDPAVGADWDLGGGGIAILETSRQPRSLLVTVSRGGEVGQGGPPRARFSHADPDPFSARIALVFVQPEAGDVRADLYDAMGRHMRSLVRERAPAGEAVLVWDGRSERGEQAASGVYFVRWSAGGARGSTRIVKVD